MRFSTICLLFLSTLGTSDAIHIHKLQQHVKHVLDAKVDVSWNNPANFPEENRSWGSLDVATNPQVAALFNAATGDNAGTVGAVPWSPWTLIMSNLPGPLLAAIPGGGCGNRYTIRQTCAGAGAPAHNGVYNWGVAAPVRTVSGAWECPGAGGVTQTYIGRDISQNGLVGRCRDYAPDGGIGATVAFSVAGNGRTGVPGAHQYRNFQQAAASCSCIYYRFKDYTNAVLPYTVCETGSSRRATRRWIKQRSGTDFVKNEEYLLINAQGGFGRAGATWNGVGGEQTGRTGNC